MLQDTLPLEQEGDGSDVLEGDELAIEDEAYDFQIQSDNAQYVLTLVVMPLGEAVTVDAGAEVGIGVLAAAALVAV